MDNIIIFILITCILLGVILLYFKVAEKFNIIDRPNHRSSHSTITIRGAGILFPIAMLLQFFFFRSDQLYFLGGLLIISIISFLDDLSPVSNKLRIIVHLFAVGLLIFQLNGFSLPGYIIIAVMIFAIGTINAINFMDGINGITGAYSFVTMTSLWYLNEYVVRGFTSSNLIITSILAITVFNFFNFRKNARCFAGDVGSVSIAFILIFFMGQLIITSGNPSYIFLLLVYGMDTFTTILFRIIRKENIFEAHRGHFFQYLSNERNIPHLSVALSYALVQLVFNMFLIFTLIGKDIVVLGISLFVLSIFMAIRLKTEGKERLLNHTK